jgi:CBS domain-containing protein
MATAGGRRAWEVEMLFNGSELVAADVMTRDVATVRPDTTLRQVARVLVSRRISGVPVVDEAGGLIGMVTEADLLKPDTAREERHHEWLRKLADGYDLAPEFAAAMQEINRPASAVMHRNVVCVSETTTLAEIADLMAKNAIKRVPVLRDGKLVGVVSRFDLIRAIARSG